MEGLEPEDRAVPFTSEFDAMLYGLVVQWLATLPPTNLDALERTIVEFALERSRYGKPSGPSEIASVSEPELGDDEEFVTQQCVDEVPDGVAVRQSAVVGLE